MSKLVSRLCPGCGAGDAKVLFRMTFEQFVQANPTHNVAWFDSLGFDSDDLFEFGECADCGMVYSTSRLEDELHHAFYHEGINDEKSLQKIFRFRKRLGHLEHVRRLLSVYEDTDRDFRESPLRVLDFGAGWGDFLATIQVPGTLGFGLEIDERKIAFANKIGVASGGFDFVKNNAPYDVFMCDQVLEHIDTPRDSLHQLREMLRVGAVGFVAVPNWGSLRRHVVNGRVTDPAPKEINPWGHLNYFTGKTLREMLSQTGFREMAVKKNRLVDLSTSAAKTRHSARGLSLNLKATAKTISRRLTGTHSASDEWTSPRVYVRAV